MTDQSIPEKPEEKPASGTGGQKPASNEPSALQVAPPQGPGPMGELLQKHKITSKRLADSSGVETVELAPKDLEATMKLLKNEPSFQLNFLVAVSGVDSPETYDSVYHLRSYFNQSELVIKVRVPKSAVKEGELPEVPSLASFWETANWHERESYDLLGIRYTDHPYLRRILNPWNWEGHPLRRDYKQPVDALNNKAEGSFR